MSGLLVSFPTAGVMFALRQSNLAGKVIVAILFIGSIFAWSLMITKMRELAQARRTSASFLRLYRQDAHPAAVFLKRRKFEESPLYAVYAQACVELGAALESRGAAPEDLFMGGVGSSEPHLSEMQVSAIRNVAERTMADQSLLMERSMGLLATATTTAPFLGLLGTVWGVMDSFAGMAVTGTAMLSAVAPGVSGALLTTVVGLLVALPSAIGYNMLGDQIRRLTVMLSNFCEELVSDVERHYLHYE